MNRRLINQSAFDLARTLTGQVAGNLGEEELRQRFEECFKTCRAGLEAFCLHQQRIHQQLHPLEKSHATATATAK